MVTPAHVWIHYQPRIYTDLFNKIIHSLGAVAVTELINWDSNSTGSGEECLEDIEMVVASLDQRGKPELEVDLERFPNARLIALSPLGDYALRRQPGAADWEEIRPFGLKQLIHEVTLLGEK